MIGQRWRVNLAVEPRIKTRWACPVGDLSWPLQTALPVDDDFPPISRYISQTVQDGAIVTMTD